MTKSELRAEIKRLSASLPEKYIRSSNAAIFSRLTALPEFLGAPRIFAYCSVGREVDTRALIAHCLRSGKSVALPRTEPDGKMSFALIDDPPSELWRSVYGIPEPELSAPKVTPSENDLIIVPALCFDEAGYRLGHGGGYYDRFLSGATASSVGLCRDMLLQSFVPREPHDIAVSILLTESKTARPKMGPAR